MAETLVEQLHFSRDELEARLAQTRKTLVSQGLDGIFVVSPGEYVLPHRLRH